MLLRFISESDSLVGTVYKEQPQEDCFSLLCLSLIR